MNEEILLEARKLGIVVGGSLSGGLTVKLDPRAVIEGVAVGRYVVVKGQTRRFFGIITDVSLDTTNPFLEKSPPDVSDPFISEVITGTGVFGKLNVSVHLVLEENSREPKPARTIPAHFSPVYYATQEDVERVFGREGIPDRHFFYIGEPIDMEGIRLVMDMEKLVERSSGVFGKSGTGKTFLTRLLLTGILREKVATCLVFDMHSEYGWEAEGEKGKRFKGLRQLFGDKVAIFTLDPESTLRRGIRPDAVVRIPWQSIEPEDLITLQGILDISEAGIGAIYAMRRAWGKEWLEKFFVLEDESFEELVERHRQSPQTLNALHRKLSRLQDLPFFCTETHEDSVRIMLEYILSGRSVVLEFGRFGRDLRAYIVVANYITRRIHEEFVRMKEIALGGFGSEPPQLVIVIEEAHKFLDPLVARQTIFGTIAREMRKYNVTLLVVDQRPSGIDEEVMSQIATRITCLLDNEADIKAVLSGIPGAGGLRDVLVKLETRQQALILGHAVPMPVPIRVRDYGTPEFYASFQKILQPETRALIWGSEKDNHL
ncbi:MAG: ATP-binding protein [Anaerolineae bacterium]|nr:ATP-binding protein [Anaerolineae bacterium]MDW8101703.1 ATP-binding protein [Anaerolineae bacterium]